VYCFLFSGTPPKSHVRPVSKAAAAADDDESPSPVTAAGGSKTISPITQSVSPDTAIMASQLASPIMQSLSPSAGTVATKRLSPTVQSSSLDSGALTSKPVQPSKQSLSPAGSAAVASSPTVQSASKKSPTIQRADGRGENDDATSRELDQIDAMTFSQSARFLRTSSPADSSPGLVTASNVTRHAPLITSSSPENTSAAESTQMAELVLRDSVSVLGMKSPKENRSPLVISSSPDASAVSVNNSRPISPSVGQADFVGSKRQQSTRPSTSMSDAVHSPHSASSAGPRRLSAFLAGLKSLRSPDSAPATLAEKDAGAGRGKMLLAMLKAQKTEVGASASHSSPELSIGSEFQDSAENWCSGRKPPSSTNLEQMPKHMVLSGWLDEDFESRVEPEDVPHFDDGRCGLLQQTIHDQPHPGEGWHQVPVQLAAEKQTSSKSSECQSGIAEPMNQCDVGVTGTALPTTTNTMNQHDVDVHNTALAQNTTDTAMMTNTPRPSPSVASGENLSGQLQPGEQATPTTRPQSEQMGRSHTPLSCDSSVHLEHSPGGSSADVSLCSKVGDRPASTSKMLTKRLPKIALRPHSRPETPVLSSSSVLPGASRSNSRTGTTTPVSLPPHGGQKSPSPLAHRFAPSSSASASSAVLGRSDNFNVIPELRSESVTRHSAAAPAAVR